jgi:hypothetical protein
VFERERKRERERERERERVFKRTCMHLDMGRLFKT